jgi:predicted TIM-barrel fold metal-dependent hydrolase
MNRRTFLQTTALASLAPAGLAAAESVAQDCIDAHVHVWTPDTERYPLASIGKKSEMVPPSFTPEELFAHSKPAGVSRVVLIQMSFYQYDNRYMLDSIAKYPGVFSGVAIIDENAPDLRGTMERLKNAGVRGFRLYTTREMAEGWGTSENMKKMWSLGAELGMAMCLLADPESLPAIDRMCSAFPKTRVVIDHFARLGMKGPAKPEDLALLTTLAKHQHTFVKTSAFYALGAKQAPYTDLGPMIRQLRDAFGAQRLMWASDCPFQVQEGHTYANSIALIRDRLDFLTPEDKHWMLRKTADRVFFG